MIQEPWHLPDGLPGIAAESGGGVAQDVEPRGRKAGLVKVAAESTVEGTAASTSVLLGVCTLVDTTRVLLARGQVDDLQPVVALDHEG